ncbi:TPA: hypothetical protein OZE80_001849, partial [Staphylococcus aureus]|nr:hypothetical protein [Staphylococcus aureus]
LVRGPNTEADEKSAYNNVQVGVWAPTKRISKRNSTGNASWGWAPTKRISKRNSTDNASWRGPNIEAGGKSAYNNVQVGGAPT